MFRKILIILFLPLNYILYFISGLIKKNCNIWVFGSYGVFNDNSSYLFRYIQENPSFGIRAIWISKNKISVSEAKYFGESYYAFSLKGLYFCLKSKVYVFSAYVSDINFFTSRKSLKVNLWHGIPLKKIEFDITTKPLIYRFRKASFLRKIATPEAHTKPDLLLSPSEYVADYSFKSAFRVNNSNIIIAEYPRVNYLKECKALVQFSAYKKVFLYAPTWRDDSRDFIEEARIDLVKLNNLMKENNSIFIFKLHSATRINIDLSSFSNLILIDHKLDSISLLKIAHCLITDYSSIYFDYLCLDRPIIHFCFDLDSYLKNREMYLDYNDSVAGAKVSSFEELLYEIEYIINNNDRYSNLRKNTSRIFLSNRNDNRYIIEKIIEKLEV